MDWRQSDDSAERFSAYLDAIAGVMGHAARVAPMRDYCSGLLLDCERKSAEPIAAAKAPNATSAKHQSLLHFLAKGEWSDAKVLGKVRGRWPHVCSAPSYRGACGRGEPGSCEYRACSRAGGWQSCAARCAAWHPS